MTTFDPTFDPDLSSLTPVQTRGGTWVCAVIDNGVHYIAADLFDPALLVERFGTATVEERPRGAIDRLEADLDSDTDMVRVDPLTVALVLSLGLPADTQLEWLSLEAVHSLVSTYAADRPPAQWAARLAAFSAAEVAEADEADEAGLESQIDGKYPGEPRTCSAHGDFEPCQECKRIRASCSRMRRGC